MANPMGQSNGSMDTGRGRAQPLRLAPGNTGSWAALAHQKLNLLGEIFSSVPPAGRLRLQINFCLIRINSRMGIDLGI